MKRIASSLILLSVSLLAGAQKLDWNVRFDYLLRNYEYDRSHNVYDDSYTIHAARLTPEIGLLVKQNNNVYHRMRVGIDILKDMGEGKQNLDLFREMTFYYNVEAILDNGGRFEAIAGCFPNTFPEGDAIGPYFDDDYVFYNNNLEGVFFKYRNKRIFAEIGLDWPGMFGDTAHPLRRERFQVMGAGTWNFAGDFNFCWTGSFYHYSFAPNLPNVVDNHMCNPWFQWEPFCFFDDLRLDLGGIFTYQCDRIRGMNPKFPMGLYSRQIIGKWGVAIDNYFYYGDDLMPLMDMSYNGVPYEDLYFGDRGFHTLFDRPSWVDYFHIKYEPELKACPWLSLSVVFSFHLGEPSKILDTPVFRGWQQGVELKVNLESLRPHPTGKKSRRGYHSHFVRYSL